MGKNIKFTCYINLDKDELVFISSLQSSNYKGIDENNIEPDDTEIVSGLIAKGILFRSTNELKESAIFLTPLGGQILTGIVEDQNLIKMRRELILKVLPELEKLKDESSLFEIDTDKYWTTNQKLESIRECDKRLVNSKITEALKPEPELSEMDMCKEEVACVDEEPHYARNYDCDVEIKTMEFRGANPLMPENGSTGMMASS